MELLPSQTGRRDRPVAGGLLVLASALLFSGVGAIVKAASAELPAEVVVFFRNATAMAFLIPLTRCSEFQELGMVEPET